MSERKKIKVRMLLESDAVFGSGYSIPGGEDIAVQIDDRGYPYLKGSTFKGILRESLENLLAWTDGKEETLEALMGAEGWNGEASERRINTSSLKLENPPASPEACFAERTFTKIENGTVAPGTLRIAACIRRGLTFIGELCCDASDIDLIMSALSGILWVGTSRSRGFGKVRISGKLCQYEEKSSTFPNARGIRYRLRTDLPMIITDLSQSQNNSYETRGYIPGTAVRGYVISSLAQRSPEWFEANRISLLSEQTRFLDAIPCPDGKTAVPSPKGFYENKEETRLETVLVNGNFDFGFKRAKLGSFCCFEDSTIEYWSAKTGGATRIQRNVSSEEDTKPFRTRYLCEGQEFEGIILLENPELAPKIASALNGEIWIGADRYEGFEKCTLTKAEPVTYVPWSEKYGYCDKPSNTLYMMAVSPFCMTDEKGNCCGINNRELAKALNVQSMEVELCATSLIESGGYNRTWECRAPAIRMYDRGSIFKLKCDGTPAPETLRKLEYSGIGIRKAEGFGQVLFLRPELIEKITDKKALETKAEGIVNHTAEVRRARINRIMETSEYDLKNLKVSKSQLGSIQAFCESALANGGNTDNLTAFFDKNINNRGARHGDKFEKINELVKDVLNNPVNEQIKCQYAEDSKQERIKLLIDLFDFHRKGEEEKQ